MAIGRQTSLPSKPLHTEPRTARCGEINAVRRGPVNGDRSAHGDGGGPIALRGEHRQFTVELVDPGISPIDSEVWIDNIMIEQPSTATDTTSIDFGCCLSQTTR
jgi:hypothetical protein